MAFLEAMESLHQEFSDDVTRLKQAFSPAIMEELRIKWLGRKGRLAHLFAELKSLQASERPSAGKKINDFEQEIAATMTELKEAARVFGIQARLNAHPVDVTLPVSDRASQGALHPVSLMKKKLAKEFSRLGFSIHDGPELEFDSYNFSYLNLPADHPARDMQDTFFIKDHPGMVLRTHTSNIQIHTMLAEKPPLRAVSFGRCYRVDSDATHSPMFHQVEGFIVDEGITFAHLKGILDAFMRSLFGSELKTRFRPSYFPFVEPGAEMDLQCSICKGKGTNCRVCKETGWLELGGCGMIHPKVFKNVDYDAETYSGFAFGFGIDRMAMLTYGLDDLRLLFEGDAAFHSQFPIYV